MTVLIITHSRDNDCIDRVSDAIEQRGESVFRFDTDRFPTELQLEVYYGQDGERLRLTDQHRSLDLREISAVWYRRIATGDMIPDTMDRQLRQASMQESHETVQGMIASLDAFHLDPVPHLRRAENKQLQLQIARRLGIDTPRTLISNDPIAVRRFAAGCPHGMITKMLSSFAVYENDQEKVVFTNPVSVTDLDQLDGLRYCPMTFQEQLDKTLELRVTVVGTQVFAAAVDSQQTIHARYDWRRQGVTLLDAWQPYNLPDDLTDRLLKLMRQLGLNYGAIDIILTPDNRHVFLEVNPVGEFFWLDRSPGLPIADALGSLLISQGQRYQSR